MHIFTNGREERPVSDRATELVLAGLQAFPYNVEFASMYGEPGYNKIPEQGILFCNWNEVGERTQSYLERAGYELEWADEWYVDEDGKAWRTQPDSFYWRSSLYLCADGGYLTRDNVAEVIDAAALNGVSQLGISDHLPEWIYDESLKSAGFERYPGTINESALFDHAKALFREDSVIRIAFRYVLSLEGYECWIEAQEEEVAHA